MVIVSSLRTATFRRTAVVLTAVAALLLPAGTAYAEEVVQRGILYTDNANLCVHGVSKLTQNIDHDEVRRARATASSRTFYTCTGNPWPDRSFPRDHVIVNPTLWRWNDTAWVECFNKGWVANTAELAGHSVTYTWNYGPCGGGYYGVNAGVFVWDGFAWRGGWTWSGYLWIPGDPGA